MDLAETTTDLLSQIIEAVSQPEIPPDVTEVRIMSLHKSKGLSSPIVVIAGCVDGLLPAEPEQGTAMVQRQAHLEEQRRLFYVGVTRVKAAPASNRPGSLLLTGSQTMTLADAMQSAIQPAGKNSWSCIAAPEPIYPGTRSKRTSTCRRVIADAPDARRSRGRKTPPN